MEISPSFALKSENTRSNHPLLPNNLRALIVGKSGSGKTTVLLNLLLQEGWLDYENLFVFGKSLFQDEYRLLKEGIDAGLSKKDIRNWFEGTVDSTERSNLSCEFFTEGSDIPDPSELESKKNLFVFDDCLLGSQIKPESYYTRGRHSDCDCIYIGQNYFKVPRQTIRENCNFLIIFPQDNKNLNHIHADHATDISLKEFKEFCRIVWKKPRSFVVVDLTSRIENGKYRRNFTDFYFPNELEQQISD